MLRSLVGSEMCIRDSGRAAGRFVHRRGNARNLELVVQVQQHADGEVGIACLLYTSDAADDLLCVDLGGRRIIKKKNNKYT